MYDAEQTQDESLVDTSGDGGTVDDDRAPEQGPSAQEDPGAETSSKTWSLARRGLWRGVLVVIALVVVYYFVIPEVSDARHDFQRLSQIKWWLLIAGVALQLAALGAYTQLTMAALPGERHHRPVSFFTLLRIQLSTKSVTHLVPGGSATGSALGYRLLVTSGVPGTDSAFAMATVGLGSAVVLNLMLWVALLVSIPRSGLQPAYATAAISGAIALLLVAALVFLLMKGQGPLDRIVRSVASRLPRVDPDAASKLLSQVVGHLRELAARPDVVRRGIAWAAANWLFDAASLWVFLAAFGQQVDIDSLLVAFGIANVLAVIPITPGGLGVVEAALTSTLIGFGVPSRAASLGVFSYRLAQFWLPIPLGAASYLSLKIWPGETQDASRRQRLRQLATEMLDHPTGGTRS